MAPGTYHVAVRLSYGENGNAINESQLEIGAVNVVKATANSTQVPGVIGVIGSNPVAENPQSPVQAPVTALLQDGSGKWLWVLGGTGLVLLAIIAVLAIYVSRARRLGVQSKSL